MTTDPSMLEAVVLFASKVMLAHWLIGSALVVTVSLLLKMTRRTNAATRHAVWLAVLVSLAALPLVSVVYPNSLVTDTARATGTPIATMAAASGAESEGIREAVVPNGLQIDSRMESSSWPINSLAFGAAALLALLWLVLALRAAARLAVALVRLRQSRAFGQPAPEAVARAVQELARATGVSRTPAVRIDQRLESPAAFGLRHRWIALPPNWPGSLSRRAQRHALLHEIAHLERHDGWLQVFQRLAEIPLCLHPALPFLRNQIATERECACDDWAINKSRTDPADYGESLLECFTSLRKGAADRFHESLNDTDRLAAAFLPRPSQLKRRVLNMTSPLRNHRTALQPLALSLALLAGGSLTVATAAAWPNPSTLTGKASTATQPEKGYDESSATILNADDSPVYRALERDDLERVRELLDQGEDVNQIWPGDGSPLIVAARSNSLETVQLLLDRGARVDLGVGGDGTPLIQAAARGDIEMAELLLDYGADIDHHGRGGDGNPLIEASKTGREAMVQYLVERGAAIDLHIQDDDTPLINAVQQGHVKIVSYLLAQGADPNLEGDFDRRIDGVRTPLNQARNSQIREMLRRAGASN